MGTHITVTDGPQLLLASASPRRRQILESLRLDFVVVPVQIDEHRQATETAEEMVLRLAAEKARAAERPVGNIVLGADTAVVLGDRILGKPADAQDAIAMLLALAGRTHRVLTGVAAAADSGVVTALSDTAVRFREIHPDEAWHYWHSGEPADKAGGYGIQGIGGMFVSAISGSYSGVVGLPVFETVKLLQTAGIDVFESA